MKDKETICLIKIACYFSIHFIGDDVMSCRKSFTFAVVNMREK